MAKQLSAMLANGIGFISSSPSLPLFLFFLRLCNSAQHCVREISKSKMGWRKPGEARQKHAEAAERMVLAPAL